MMVNGRGEILVFFVSEKVVEGKYLICFKKGSKQKIRQRFNFFFFKKKKKRWHKPQSDLSAQNVRISIFRNKKNH